VTVWCCPDHAADRQAVAASVNRVRCPLCLTPDTRVVDSRTAEEGATIRRRRSCQACGHRFTTYERLEEVPLMVVKRSGGREPFDRVKIIGGVQLAAKGRPVTSEQLESLAADVEDSVRLEGAEVPSELIGAAVLRGLRLLDEVAYLRFASVHKSFDDAEDFEREARLLNAPTSVPAEPRPEPTEGART
jgi:transcriptional repressor NrdR